MKPEDFKPNDVVLVDRVGSDDVHRVFISWIVSEARYAGPCGSVTTYLPLAHGNTGLPSTRIDGAGTGHNVKLSKITLLFRPASVQERDLFIALHPDL